MVNTRQLKKYCGRTFLPWKCRSAFAGNDLARTRGIRQDFRNWRASQRGRRIAVVASAIRTAIEISSRTGREIPSGQLGTRFAALFHRRTWPRNRGYGTDTIAMRSPGARDRRCHKTSPQTHLRACKDLTGPYSPAVNRGGRNKPAARQTARSGCSAGAQRAPSDSEVELQSLGNQPQLCSSRVTRCGDDAGTLRRC